MGANAGMGTPFVKHMRKSVIYKDSSLEKATYICRMSPLFSRDTCSTSSATLILSMMLMDVDPSIIGGMRSKIAAAALILLFK